LARPNAGEPFLRHLVAAAIEAYPEIPIVMHQDHGASPNVREFDPRKFLQAAMEETTKLCIERFGAFGSAGQAEHIAAVELEVMAQRYRSGPLRQIVH
jgi:fructose/tagatose bisphosphate aldolase